MNPNPSCSKNRNEKEKEIKSKIKMKRENKIKSTVNDLDNAVNVTITEAELFAVSCGINQAIQIIDVT